MGSQFRLVVAELFEACGIFFFTANETTQINCNIKMLSCVVNIDIISLNINFIDSIFNLYKLLSTTKIIVFLSKILFTTSFHQNIFYCIDNFLGEKILVKNYHFEMSRNVTTNFLLVSTLSMYKFSETVD